MVFVVLFVVCSYAWADTLLLRSGETKKGKLIEQIGDTYLFESGSDGAVIEVPVADVSILDRDPGSQNLTHEFVSLISEKKKELATKSEKSLNSLDLDKLSDGVTFEDKKGSFFNKMELMLMEWLQKHPEAQGFFKKVVDNDQKSQEEILKLKKIAESS